MALHGFGTLTSLDLKVSGLQGSPWVYGRNDNVPVFTAPGEYRISVGANLESDVGAVESCTVNLVD